MLRRKILHAVVYAKQSASPCYNGGCRTSVVIGDAIYERVVIMLGITELLTGRHRHRHRRVSVH